MHIHNHPSTLSAFDLVPSALTSLCHGTWKRTDTIFPVWTKGWKCLCLTCGLLTGVPFCCCFAILISRKCRGLSPMSFDYSKGDVGLTWEAWNSTQ